MQKWSIVAYVLWLFLGCLGVHHFYLGRDRQGILWLTTFGGMFGLGWLRDFWNIPTYVQDANEEPRYMELLVAKMRYHGGPPIYPNLHRIIGGVMIGYFYRFLVINAIPEEFAVPALVFALGPIGTAFGVYMVSNVGRLSTSWKYSAIGAYFGEVLFGVPHLLYPDGSTPSLAVAVCVLFSVYGWEFRRQRVKSSFLKRLGVWTFFCLLFSGLFVSGVYFNASVETADGETVKVREAVNNFLKSPHWREIKKSMWKVYEDFRAEGWEGASRRIVLLADVEGEEHSLQVLGLEKGVDFKQVKERHRELAKEWHPDKTHLEDKAHAQERFMEIQKAYETLSKIYTRRKDRHS